MALLQTALRFLSRVALFLLPLAVSSAERPPGSSPSQAQDGADLLATIQQHAFEFFWFEADAETGLVKDRAGNNRGDDYTVASIAGTGFGLAVLPVGVEHGWVTRDQARRRAL